jgi:signal transduction histidine kinase
MSTSSHSTITERVSPLNSATGDIGFSIRFSSTPAVAREKAITTGDPIATVDSESIRGLEVDKLEGDTDLLAELGFDDNSLTAVQSELSMLDVNNTGAMVIGRDGLVRLVEFDIGSDDPESIRVKTLEISEEDILAIQSGALRDVSQLATAQDKHLSSALGNLLGADYYFGLLRQYKGSGGDANELLKEIVSHYGEQSKVEAEIAEKVRAFVGSLLLQGLSLQTASGQEVDIEQQILGRIIDNLKAEVNGSVLRTELLLDGSTRLGDTIYQTVKPIAQLMQQGTPIVGEDLVDIRCRLDIIHSGCTGIAEEEAYPDDNDHDFRRAAVTVNEDRSQYITLTSAMHDYNNYLADMQLKVDMLSRSVEKTLKAHEGESSNAQEGGASLRNMEVHRLRKMAASLADIYAKRMNTTSSLKDLSRYTGNTQQRYIKAMIDRARSVIPIIGGTAREAWADEKQIVTSASFQRFVGDIVRLAHTEFAERDQSIQWHTSDLDSSKRVAVSLPELTRLLSEATRNASKYVDEERELEVEVTVSSSAETSVSFQDFHQVTTDEREPQIIAVGGEINNYLQGREHFLVTVADNGIGMNAEQLPKVVELGGRLCEKEGVKGTGTGFSSMINIMREHGGLLFIKSKHGAGTELVFAFPTCD